MVFDWQFFLPLDDTTLDTSQLSARDRAVLLSLINEAYNRDDWDDSEDFDQIEAYLSDLINRVATIESVQMGQIIAEVRAPSGVSGGTSASGFQKRTLTDIVHNSISGASLVAGNIELPAGTYILEGIAEGYQVADHWLELVKVAATTHIAVGISLRAVSGASSTVSAIGKLTITAPTQVGLRHHTSNAVGTQGLGRATSNGFYEKYGELKATKIA